MRRVVLLLVLVLPLLAGCTDKAGAPAPETILNESHRIGERLFSHGWDPFPYGIDAILRPGPDAARIGVRLTGVLGEGAKVNVSLHDAEGVERLQVEAVDGGRDDNGVIDRIFTLSRSVAAEAGEWSMRIRNDGEVVTLAVDVHALPTRPGPVSDPLVLARDGRLEITLDIAGWGPPPRVRIETEEGALVHALPDLLEERVRLVDLVDLDAGTYRLVAEPGSWGGRIAWQAILH